MKRFRRNVFFGVFISFLTLISITLFVNCQKASDTATPVAVINPSPLPELSLQIPILNLTYPHPTINLNLNRTFIFNDFLGINIVPDLFTESDWQLQANKISQLGIKWVRIALFWNLIENDSGVRNYAKLDSIMATAKAAGLKVLIYAVAPPAPVSAMAAVPPANANRADQYPPAPSQYSYYANFLKEIVQRYKDTNSGWGISAVQIWNEPNLRAFWQTADDPNSVSALTSSVHSVFTSYDSSIKLILAGLAYWGVMVNSSGTAQNMFVDYFYGLGTFNLVNAVAVHPYLNNPYGDIDSTANPNPYNFITNGNYFISAIGAPVVNAGKLLWATEWGWGSCKSSPASSELVLEDTQAVYILQRLSLMMAMGFEKAFLFTIQDMPNTVSPPFQTMGLLDSAMNSKLSFTSLQRFLSFFKDETLSPENPPTMTPDDQKIWKFAFKGSSGKHYLILWSDQSVSVNITLGATLTGLNPFDGNPIKLIQQQSDFLITIPRYPILLSY